MPIKIFILIIFISSFVSCGPHAITSDNNDGPGVCGVKDKTLADTSKIILQTTTEVNGYKLFTSHCRKCHVPFGEGIRDGNNLDGLFNRLPSENYFKNYVQDSYSLKKSGDAYANHLDSQYNYDYEHHFKDTITEKEIIDIGQYIKLASKSMN